jgi:hypothetical protein
VYHHIVKKKADVEVLIDHLMNADIIPMNLSLFTTDLQKIISEKLSPCKKPIELDDFLVKDICTSEYKLIEENKTHNEELKAKIEKVMKDKPKICRDIIVLKNRLK